MLTLSIPIKNMNTRTLLLPLITLGLTNCATIMSTSNYPVTITSAKPTSVRVLDKKTGSIVHQAQTPTTVTLSASAGFFKAAKYSLISNGSQQDLKATIDPWYAGNIIPGGLIGSLIIDPATGDMWQLPKKVNLK